MRPELAVTDGAHRGMARGQTAVLAQPPHLFEKARRHNRLEPLRQPLVQPPAIIRVQQPIAQWGSRKRTRRRALQQREWPPGAQTYFERSLDALTVIRGDARRRLGVEPRELGVQRGPTLLRGARIERCPQLRRGLG